MHKQISVITFLACSGGALASDHRQPIALDVNPHWFEPFEERGRALHVAMPIPYAVSFEDIAHRHVRDGQTVFLLTLESEGAIFMSAKFSRFILPDGVSVTLSARDDVYVAGPFTSENMTSTGRFGTPMIPGDRITIEIQVPRGVEMPEIVFESVSHGYKDVLGMGRFFDDYAQAGGATGIERGGEFSCQRDIVCEEGQPYIHLKDAVAEGYDGAYVCSGQLVNNTRNDGRYLYLTAAHCGWWQDPSTMAYYWDYANETCDGNDFPAFTYSLGSTNLYHSTNPDYDINLLELDGTNLEGAFDIYYAGWNRGSTPPTSTFSISHPDDKPMQIAIDNDPAIDCNQGPCPGGWGGEYWRITDYEVGMPEGGSSGSALFDQNQLVVGVLTGGVGTNCFDFGWDEYYKLSNEWAQLQPFLDPDNTGALTMPGWDGSTNPCPPDLNNDGELNFFDVSALLVGYQQGADYNGDGATNYFDISAFYQDFIYGCP
jgi:lysyl endopeptidase